MTDRPDDRVQERRSDGNAHMWTTQEIERVAMIAARRVADELKAACEAERMAQASTWKKVEKLVVAEELKTARRERLRNTVIGQIFVLCGTVFLAVGAWVVKILWERLRDGAH